MALYQPDIFETYGRKLKIEYLGMASVYTVIALYFFGGLPSLTLSIIAMMGSFFLFLGMKKKTKDHFSGSLILFLSVAVGWSPVVVSGWELQYMMFGFAVFAMEGYLEKRQYRIYLLPLLFFFWAYKDISWSLGFVFAAMYLTHPWSEKPGLRRRLMALIVISLVIGLLTSVIRYNYTEAYPLWSFQHGMLNGRPLSVGCLILIYILTLVCMIKFLPETFMPHRLNIMIFCAVSGLDGRLAAVFAMVAAVFLSATMFRNSIYSDRLRPYFKHAEWYYFWVVFAVALHIVFKRPAI
ncbi:MAG: hypothetical protein JW944_08675 [Deltaproteobacteria bacterium]|nr:hypothetical protein [Deltaproteobacteria bacterium]